MSLVFRDVATASSRASMEFDLFTAGNVFKKAFKTTPAAVNYLRGKTPKTKLAKDFARDLQELDSLGGLTTFPEAFKERNTVQSIETSINQRRNIVSRSGGKLHDALMLWSGAMEQASRVALWRATTTDGAIKRKTEKQGSQYTKADAATFNAEQLNHRQRGRRNMDGMFPFFRTSITSLSNLMKLARRNPGRATATMAVLNAVGAAAWTEGYFSIIADNEWEDKSDDWLLKNHPYHTQSYASMARFMILPGFLNNDTDSDKQFTAPLPLGVGFFMSMGAAAARASIEGYKDFDRHAMDWLKSSTAVHFSPVGRVPVEREGLAGSIANIIATPSYAIGLIRDFANGEKQGELGNSKIVPNKRLPDHLNSRYYTEQIYKDAALSANDIVGADVSPETMAYFGNTFDAAGEVFVDFANSIRRIQGDLDEGGAAGAVGDLPLVGGVIPRRYIAQQRNSDYSKVRDRWEKLQARHNEGQKKKKRNPEISRQLDREFRAHGGAKRYSDKLRKRQTKIDNARKALNKLSLERTLDDVNDTFYRKRRGKLEDQLNKAIDDFNDLGDELFD